MRFGPPGRGSTPALAHDPRTPGLQCRPDGATECLPWERAPGLSLTRAVGSVVIRATKTGTTPTVEARERYTIEIILRPREPEERPLLMDVEMRDHITRGNSGGGVIDFDLTEREISAGYTAGRFIRRFLRGEALPVEDGLAFGRMLFDRFVGEKSLQNCWERAQARRRERPLRLELVFPERELRSDGEETEKVLALDEIPFELLADRGGFLFRRKGAALVRTMCGVEGHAFQIREGMNARLFWANTPVKNKSGADETIPAEVFASHEDVFTRQIGALNLRVHASVREVTRARLRDVLLNEGPIELISLVAHGSPVGGALYVHGDAQSGQGAVYESISARDLAGLCQRGGVRVILLWSCHGARWNPVSASMASALLDQETGVMAVVTAHAALRADGTPRLAEDLLGSLRGVAEGDLERAVTEARCAFPESDLQWAAPVYYARPLEGRSVTWEVAQAEASKPRPRSPFESMSEPEVLVAKVPEQAEAYQGRDDERERVRSLLRMHRIVSIVGMPGMGKTALAIDVASAIQCDPDAGVERVLWISLEFMRSADTLRGRIALALGVEPAGVKDAQELARHIGGRALLFVLDNAEDLLKTDRAGTQRFLQEIFASCGGVRLLLTTRRLLGDVGTVREESYTIAALKPPSDREVFVAQAGERLRMEDRASPELDDLVEALGGHPLSLVLVAGLVGRAGNLKTLRERLVERRDVDAVLAHEWFDDGIGTTDDAELRAQRLVSSLNLSFEPLRERDPAAAEMFVWLGRIPGGVPRALLGSIFGEDADAQVATLMRNHLVWEEGIDQRVGLPGPFRWYAQNREGEVLKEERRQELVLRTTRALAFWLDVWERRLGTGRSGEAYLHTEEDGQTLDELIPIADEEAMEHLADALRDWSRLMKYYGACSVAQLVLQSMNDRFAKRNRQSLGRAEVMQALGDLSLYRANFKEAEESYRQALACCDAVGHELGKANGLLAMGDLHLQLGQLYDARADYRESLRLFRIIGGGTGKANVLFGLGEVCVQLGEFDSARGYLAEALSIFEQRRDSLGVANTLQVLGRLASEIGDRGQAWAIFMRSRALHESIENSLGVAGVHGYLSRIACEVSLFDRAIVLAKVAVDILVRTESLRNCMIAFDDLAEAFARKHLTRPTVASKIMAWGIAWSFKDPSEPERAVQLKSVLPEWDSSQGPTKGDANDCQIIIETAVKQCEDELKARGEDVYSPIGSEASPDHKQE